MFEQQLVPNELTPYYASVSAEASTPTAALAAWLIELLRTKASKVKDVAGETTITYSWIYNMEPQKKIYLPSVGITVSLSERRHVGRAIQVDGQFVRGGLYDAVVEFMILANNPKMAEDIEQLIYTTIFKEYYMNNPMFTYIEKTDFGDDRGFSMVDRFIMNSFWQNLTEKAFIKSFIMHFGFTLVFQSGSTDDFYVLGKIEGNMNEGEAGFVSSRISTRLVFTPDL